MKPPQPFFVLFPAGCVVAPMIQQVMLVILLFPGSIALLKLLLISVVVAQTSGAVLFGILVRHQPVRCCQSSSSGRSHLPGNGSDV
jgi:hypothetical protein